MKRDILIAFFLVLVLLSSCKSIINRCPKSYLDEMMKIKVRPTNPDPILVQLGDIWGGTYGCSDGLLCEDQKWIIFDKGDDCIVAFRTTITGVEHIIPFYYLDNESKNVFKVDDPTNFDIPEYGIELFQAASAEIFR